MNNRRNFLSASSLAVAALGIAPGLALGGPAARHRQIGLNQVNLKTFARLTPTRFRIYLEDRSSLTLKLVEAKDLTADPKLETFSLLFLGPKTPVLKQNTYKFEHERIGSFEMFIVPATRDEPGNFYLATFNRLN